MPPKPTPPVSDDGFSVEALPVLPQPSAAEPHPNAPVYRPNQLSGKTQVTMQAGPPVSDGEAPSESRLRQTLDKTTDVLGAQGFVADVSSTALAGKGVASHFPKWLHVAMGVLVGKDRLKAVGVMGKTIHLAAKASKILPAISLPFAGYDVYKAVVEKKASMRPLAWANAAFTVGGTAVGTAALLMLHRGFRAQSVPLFALSAAIGVGQLLDAYFFDNKGQNWVGNTVKSWWNRLTG